MKKSFLRTFIVLGFVSMCFFNTMHFASAQSLNITDNALKPVSVTNEQKRVEPVLQNNARLAAKCGPTEFTCQIMEAIYGAISYLNQGWLTIITFLIAIAGIAFDLIASFTINNASYDSLHPTIVVIWRFLRDIANIMIVFSLLYLAIRTIYEGNGLADKKKLTGVLLAAIFINFSLFFTQTMFQISNYTATVIKNDIKLDTQTNAGYGTTATSAFGVDLQDNSLSAGIVKLLGIPNYITQVSQVTAAQNGGVEHNYIFVQIQYLLMLTISAGGVVIVMLAGAGFLFYRFIVFIFLLILSPIGLVAYFIPAFKKMGQEWSSKLIFLTLLAPVYFLSFYISINLIQPLLSISSVTTYTSATGNAAGSIGTLFQMFIQALLITGALMGTVILPTKIAGAGNTAVAGIGGWASKKIKTMPSRVVVGGSARGARAIGGRVGGALTSDDNKFGKALKSMATNDKNIAARMFGRTVLKGADKAQNSSFDVRNTGMLKSTKFGKELGSGIKTWKDEVDKKKKDSEKKKKDEMKLYGYDKLHETDDNRLKIREAEMDRDAKEVELKLQREVHKRVGTEATLIRLKELEKELGERELKVGELQNLGESKYNQDLAKRISSRLSINQTSRVARTQARKEAEKKWREKGESTEKRKERAERNRTNRDSSNNPPNPPPNPPPIPPANP